MINPRAVLCSVEWKKLTGCTVANASAANDPRLASRVDPIDLWRRVGNLATIKPSLFSFRLILRVERIALK